MSLINIPYRFTPQGAFDPNQFIANLDAITALYNGLLDDTNVRENQILNTQIANDAITGDHVKNNVITLARLSSSASYLIQQDKIAEQAISPKIMEGVLGVLTNLRSMFAPANNTYQLRIVFGEVTGITLDVGESVLHLGPYDFADICENDDPHFNLVPLMIFPSFHVDDADWALVDSAIDVVSYNVTQTTIKFLVKRPADKTTVRIDGSIVFTIIDYGGF